MEVRTMKIAKGLALVSIVLAPVAAGAQRGASDPHGHNVAQASASFASLAVFKQLQSLAGNWKGATNTDPAVPQMAGDSMTVSLRVTSLGNAIMHNMRSPRRKDDPITMLYLENDRLLLTHYCDSGNRPRMEASVSPDGKTVTFQMFDLVGPTTYGHMSRAVFTIIDENHHIEEWTYVLPDKSSIRARFDLRRISDPVRTSEE